MAFTTILDVVLLALLPGMMADFSFKKTLSPVMMVLSRCLHTFKFSPLDKVFGGVQYFFWFVICVVEGH